MVKRLWKPITRSTHTREDKKLQRVLVDLSGKMVVPNIGGKRFTRVYFLSKKSDAASAFE